MTAKLQEQSATAPISDLNPGSYEELHQKVRGLFPLCFDGGKLMIQKGISSHFQVSHTLNLRPKDSGYNLGATFVGSKKVVSDESMYPVLLGDTDINGNTSATLVHRFENYRLRFQSKITKTDFQGVQATLERRGRLTTLALTVANPDIVNNRGIFVGQLLRKITDRLDAGAQVLCQVEDHAFRRQGGKVSLIDYALRYTMPNWTAAATLSSNGVNLSYFHRLSDQIETGLELEASMSAQDATATFAYKAQIPETNLELRASIDTNLVLGTVLEKKLYGPDSPFTLGLSAMFDHKTSKARMGIGLMVGQ